MKRKIAMIVLAGWMSMQLIACGGQNADVNEETQNTENTQESAEEETAESTTLYLHELTPGDYVTLGEYKGMEVSHQVQKVTDEEVEAYINYLLAMSVEKEEVTDRELVENGDIVNIDYEGKKDGVAFDGGTDTGYDLTIGSGTFIDGFEEGLIGVKKGETVDLTLTFPEDYHAEELAGVETVFTVTVNGIYKEVSPEFTDEFVADLGIENIATTKEYHAYLKNLMEESNAESALQSTQMDVLDLVTENAKISNVPEELVNKYYETNVNNMTYQAMMYGMDLESFVSAYYGLDAETFENEIAEAARVSANQVLVCLKIAEEENMSVSDDELNAAVEEKYAEYGYESAEDFKNTVDLEEYRDSLLLNKVVDFLVENATITETTE